MFCSESFMGCHNIHCAFMSITPPAYKEECEKKKKKNIYILHAQNDWSAFPCPVHYRNRMLMLAPPGSLCPSWAEVKVRTLIFCGWGFRRNIGIPFSNRTRGAVGALKMAWAYGFHSAHPLEREATSAADGWGMEQGGFFTRDFLYILKSL